MRHHSFFVFAVMLLLFPLPPQEDDNISPVESCGSFDFYCTDKLDECDSWDTYCDDYHQDCPLWSRGCGDGKNTNSRISSGKIDYSRPVTCHLVLKEGASEVSGYCTHEPTTNLDHCIADARQYSPDAYIKHFRCASGTPSYSSIPDRNEISIQNLGTSFGSTPYWILCDEGMTSSAKDKQCYDSDLSDGDAWVRDCKVDQRTDIVTINRDTFAWYVCR